MDQSGRFGFHVQLEFGPDGQMYAAGFYDGYPLSTWFATHDGENWSPISEMEGRFNDFIVDRDLRPHLLVSSLIDPGIGSNIDLLKLLDDGSWENIRVVSGRVSGPSVAFDQQNRPHVCYVDTSSITLFHAYLDGAT